MNGYGLGVLGRRCCGMRKPGPSAEAHYLRTPVQIRVPLLGTLVGRSGNFHRGAEVTARLATAFHLLTAWMVALAPVTGVRLSQLASPQAVSFLPEVCWGIVRSTSGGTKR